ncbi:MAG: hypothetical protein HY560_11800 [Gemmatimonadetes bacterium]|nr:hypothetical protein [Gemmatimonadota bacterium]
MTILPDSLQLELVVPRRVPADSPAPFTLRVRNQTERPIDLYLRGRTATFDVIVTRVGGDVVWQRLKDEIIPAIVHLRALAPGEQLELTTTWDRRTGDGRPVPPGAYMARALLLIEGGALETPPVPLEIGAP